MLLFVVLLSGMLAWVCAFVVRRVAMKYGIVDVPDKEGRKIHTAPTPLLGGVSLFVPVTVLLVVFLFATNMLTSGAITQWHYVGYVLGGLILMVGGYLDDRYTLPPRLAILAPVFATVCVIVFGVSIARLTNPFGEFFLLPLWVSHVLVFLWIMTLIYTTKFLDGMDGLATGVSSVGFSVILLLTLTTTYFQPDVSLFASIVLGACLGFFLWNKSPAKLFLGEGGSTFLGYTIGVLSVISGGKLATALLVLSIPLFDMMWVVVRRFRQGGVRNIVKADKYHLHHRLLARGWKASVIPWIYMSFAAVSGFMALVLQSREKFVATIGLFFFLICFAYFLSRSKK